VVRTPAMTCVRTVPRSKARVFRSGQAACASGEGYYRVSRTRSGFLIGGGRPTHRSFPSFSLGFTVSTRANIQISGYTARCRLRSRIFLHHGRFLRLGCIRTFGMREVISPTPPKYFFSALFKTRDHLDDDLWTHEG